MISKNSIKSYNLFTLIFPQVLVFSIALISIYVVSRGHGDLNFLFSFFFLIFYGSLFLPAFAVLGVVYISKILSIKSSILSIILLGSGLICIISIPIAFLLLSLKLSKLLQSGAVNKQQLKLIAYFHFLIAFVLIIISQFSFINEFINSSHFLWQLIKIFLVAILSLIFWVSLFRFAEYRGKI